MPRRHTKESFIAKARQVHGDKYSYDKVEYKNNSTHVTIGCPIHGDFLQTPYNHLDGCGCPDCGREKCVKNRRLTVEEFFKRCEKKHNKKYDYSETVFSGLEQKITVKCSKHGLFTQLAGNHMRGAGCQKCANEKTSLRQTKSTEKFIEECKQLYGENRYDYSKTVYKHNQKPVCVICHKKDIDGNEHGEFFVRADNHRHGHGCKKCYIENTMSTTEEFIEKARKVHGDKYDYSKVIYRGCNEKVIIHCPKHGDFSQTPTSHLLGAGCGSCNNSKLENEIHQILQKNGIRYLSHHYFEWLKPQNLDFYLPDYNIAIECQGLQHYGPVDFFGGDDEFEHRKFLDERKRNLCVENGVDLVYYTLSELKQNDEFTDTEELINYIKNKKNMEEFNFQSSMGLNFANFDPSAIQSSETINVTFIIDRSGSIYDYVDDLNNVLNDFLHELQRSHVADRVMMQIIEFDSNVEVKSAFHPIADVKDFNVQPGGCTALYSAMLAGLENAVAYKEEQENNGLSSKSLVFLITDGLENCGGDANKVKEKIKEIYKDEQNSFAFSIIMFGLGDEIGFEKARDDMGIRPEMMAKLGTTAKELRKMVNFISSSVSSSASGATVSAVTF